jgi:hypothetical protein
VDAIVDRLILLGSLRSHELLQLVAPVLPRQTPPGIRAQHELHVAYDPLAYPPSDPRRATSRWSGSGAGAEAVQLCTLTLQPQRL